MPRLLHQSRQHTPVSISRQSPSGRQRLGGAVVEFAVCLPMLMIMILGSIEATSAIFVKQSLTAAAYEGAREAARLKSTSESCQAMVNNVLTNRQVKAARFQFIPSDPSSAERGQRVTVEVSASISANSPFIGNVIKDRVMTSRAVMVKE